MKILLIKIKNVVTLLLVVFLGFTSCEPYEDYVLDFEHTAVYFGAQKPIRTLVSKTNEEYLEFKIGVVLAGVRENKIGYAARFMVDPSLLATVDGAGGFQILPEDCYEIEVNNNTFIIPPGKFLGDCPVRIDKEKFINLPGSLQNTYALPLRLLSATTDSILTEKDYTVIVIKYVDEHSGFYYARGTQREWDGTAPVPGTTITYSHVDLSRNNLRLLTTRRPDQFEMQGMGILGNHATGTADNVDRLLINLVDGEVTLEAIQGSNEIEDHGSSYDPETQTFTLRYEYFKGVISQFVEEELILRQHVERTLRFEQW